MKGGIIRIPTLYGEKKINISPKTYHGQKYQIKEYGLVVEGKKGDLIIEIKNVFPEKLDKKQNELFKAFTDSLKEKNYREVEKFYSLTEKKD